MVLSSLFKPKPMISVVLTKEKIDSTNDNAGFGFVENRLDLIDCKLQKLKKHSKKVFECNNLETLSQVQACNEELKKKGSCKAKKRVRICAPGEETKTCGAKKAECMDQGDTCQGDSDSDFDCNDLNLSESDNGSAEECGAEECAEECEAEEKDPCQEEEAADEAAADEDVCPEENVCDEQSQEDQCDVKEGNECDEAKDKKCQVMTAEIGASTYLLSQLQLGKDGSIEAHVPNVRPLSTDSNERTCSIVEGVSVDKILPNCSLVIPIITTTSAHSLCRTSTRDLRIANNCTLVVSDQGSTQPLLSSYAANNSTDNCKNEKNISLSRVTIDSESCVRQDSSVPSTKKILSTSGSKINPKTSQSFKENNRSGTNRSLLKQDQLNAANLIMESDNNKQPSIIYIVQSPSQKSGSKLPCDSIRIEASKVYIQNTASQIEAFAKTNFADQNNENDQNMSDSESEIFDTPSVKLESRVSFQQPECLNIKESRQFDSGTKTQEETANAVGVSSNDIHHSSSRLLSKSAGSKTSNPEDSQIRFIAERVSNGTNDRINLEVSNEDKIYIMQKMHDSNLSNLACYNNHLSNEHFQSNVGSALSNCTKRQWEKDSLNKSACNSECARKSSPNSLVSDCDAYNKSQVPLTSDCADMRQSQVQFISADCARKSSPNSFISDCDAFNKSQVPFISDCDAMRQSQVQFISADCAKKSSPNSFVSDCDAFNKSQAPFISDCDAMRQSQVQYIPDCDATRLSQVQFVSNCEAPCNILGDNDSIQKSVPMSQISGEMPIKAEDTNLYGSNTETSEGECQTHLNHYSNEPSPNVSMCSNSRVNSNSKSRDSFNNLTNEARTSNPRVTNESLNFIPEQMTCVSNRIEKEDSIQSGRISFSNREEIEETIQLGQINNFDNRVNTSATDNGSWQTLLNQEISEVSQTNETIAMYANINIQETTTNNQKDFLVVHCNKCKELCIAKIIKKVQPDSGIWCGQRNYK